MTSTTLFLSGLLMSRRRFARMLVVVLLVGGGVVVGTGQDPASAQLPPVTVSVESVSMEEGDSGEKDMVFVVSLSGSPSHRVELFASARHAGQAIGGGRPGRDFVAFKDRSVVFEAGATGTALMQTVAVKVLGDERDEDDETFTLTLNKLRSDDDRVGFAGGKKSLRVTGTIVDDDDATATGHMISIAPVSVTEGDSGKTPMEFTVSLSGTPSHKVTLSVLALTHDDTADQGEDFVLYHADRQVVFAAGASGSDLTKTVAVYVLGDRVDEDDETFKLRLRNLKSDDRRVMFASGRGTLDTTGTIVDDDTAGVTITPQALTVVEGGDATYTVRLDSVPTGNVTVTVAGESGDVSVSGSPLTFMPANWDVEQTLTVTAAADMDTTTDPPVALTHTASGGGYDSVTIDSVTVSITEPTPTPTPTSTPTATPDPVPPSSAPAAPTGLSVVPGRTGVVASWMPGVGSACATTSYSVSIYLNNDVVVEESLDASPSPSWTGSGLSPDTTYLLEIFAYGSSCDEYSDDSAIVQFSTLLPTSAAPTDVSVMAGDTEALISWSSGIAGDCAATEYYVTVYDNDDYDEVVAESPSLVSTSWFVDELTASTAYEVEVISYGPSCDGFSLPVTATFTTNASTSTTDPAAPTKRKLGPPLSVSNLRIDTTTTTGKITISWNKPQDNKRNKRCAYTADAADHADASILYNYYIENVTTETELYFNDIPSYNSVITLTLDLPDTVENGHILQVGVSSHSQLCNEWSSYRTTQTTHTT